MSVYLDISESLGVLSQDTLLRYWRQTQYEQETDSLE